MRVAIIGGDAAGMSAAATAMRRDEDVEVVAFERGPSTSFSACGVPYLVGGLVDGPDALVSRSPEQHRARGIDVRIRTEVQAIDLAARELEVCDLRTRAVSREPFDEVVIATGAVAAPPPVPGAQAAEPARTLTDGARLRAAIERGGARAVVIGAGYIGLELAENLAARGLAVTVVEQAGQVFGTLDADMAVHVQDALEDAGVRVELSVTVEEVLLDDAGRPRAVRTDRGELPADHVTIGVGARPEVTLAEQAGLPIGDSGAIAVDAHMRCGDGVWAAGDCVESWHRILQRPVNIQLGTHANKQGRIAGTNMTGGDVRFPGVLGTAVSQVCGYEVARTGISEAEAAAAGIEVVAVTIEASTRAEYLATAGPIWVKLVAEPATGRLLGAQIVGAPGAGKRIDVLAACLWTGMAVDELALLDLAYAPPVSPVYDPVLVAARTAAQAIERA